MTRLLISTAIVGVLGLTAPALAQDRGDDHRDRGQHGQQAAPAREQAPAARPQAAQPPIGGRNGHGFTPAPAAQNAPAMRGPDNRQAVNRGPDNRDNRGPGPNNAMRGPDNRGPAPNNNPAMRGPGRDFSSFHRNFTAPRRFHVAVYNRPRGWYPHHWVFGEILPALFWTSDYWLDDYAYYGLEPPPPGTVWVRDGYDALLIDRFDGEIIEVAYNVFY